MTVAQTPGQGHVARVDTRDNAPQQPPGVSETAPAWETVPDPLLARPVDAKLNVEQLVREMHERFPVIMARLAE